MHTTSAGHGPWDEDFCVESRDNAITDASLKTRVYNTLVWDNPHWDGVGSYAVDLWVTSAYCDAMNPGPIDDVEVRFIASSYWSWCNNDPTKNVSCVVHSAWEGGHYRYADVWTDSQTVNGQLATEWHRNINHEFGHVVGLADPGNGLQGTWPNCTSASVMHQYVYYGCGLLVVEFPQFDDLANVAAQINGP